MTSGKKHLRLATITILVRDRKSNSAGVNRILTAHGHHIMARLGVNVERHCIENCLAMISVAVEATTSEVKEITKDLNKLKGITAKNCIVA